MTRIITNLITLELIALGQFVRLREIRVSLPVVEFEFNPVSEQ